MPLEVVSPRIRGFLCTNAHPAGCAAAVDEQVQLAEASRPSSTSRGNALVIGASTGYGLASWIATTFARKMSTVGVFFERPPAEKKTASAGFYNVVSLGKLAQERGMHIGALNGDAFSDEVKRQALERLRRDFGPLDLVIYSLASPVRVHPDDARTIRSTLKPVGQPYTTKTVDLDRSRVTEVTLEPATSEEIADTVAVMGGDDIGRWIRALVEARLLSDGARVLAYSYIGPRLTWPIYRTGTIGLAKADLEATARWLDGEIEAMVGGQCRVSVNAAVVTQASSAIPGVPLYLAIAYKILQEKGLLERPIDQILRLFDEQAAAGSVPRLDAEGRIRMDDREMREDVQSLIEERWRTVTTETLSELSDLDLFRREFRRLFGFEVQGIDYGSPVEIAAELPP